MGRARHAWETRIAVVLVAAAGALLGHAFSFSNAVAHVHSDGTGHVHEAAHSYLPAVMWIVVPLAALATVRLLWRGRRGSVTVGYGTLLAVQLAAFASQELIERILVGGTILHLAADPVFWVGIAAQLILSAAVPAALVLVQSARLRVWFSRALAVASATTSRASITAPGFSQTDRHSVMRRGPPPTPLTGRL